MSGGTISPSGISSSLKGGGVFVTEGATFKMSGGVISKCRADTDGGGVYVWQGVFEMSGGVISKNHSGGEYNGGGVFLGGGGVNFRMSGGVIEGNISKKHGGGVHIEGSYGLFEMSGGTISENIAIRRGGGVSMESSDCTFRMSGGVISGNISAGYDDYVDYYGGGGVAMVGSNSVFEMSGGAISGNTSAYKGGGIYIRISAVSPALRFLPGGSITIANNTALTNSNSNNVCLLTYFVNPIDDQAGIAPPSGTNGWLVELSY
jgi:hypothetical protein